jgi:hypothetical protein
VTRGGSYAQIGLLSAAEYRSAAYPVWPFDYFDGGFRLVMIPEPSTGLLVIAGLLGLAGGRRTRA